MLQQQFQQLAQLIIRRGHAIYSTEFSDNTKLAVIVQMGNELEALRHSYEKLSGQSVTMPQFNAMMQLS